MTKILSPKTVTLFILLTLLSACAGAPKPATGIAALKTPQDVDNYLKKNLGEAEMRRWNAMNSGGRTGQKQVKMTSKIYDLDRKLTGEVRSKVVDF